MGKQEHIPDRFLTAQESRRGLAALRELEALDLELDDKLLPDSTGLIHQMREEHSGQLLRKLEE